MYITKIYAGHIDSLLQKLDTTQDIKKKINLLNTIAQQEANVDYTKALEFGYQALDQALVEEYPKGISGACYNLGSVYFRTFKFDSARKYGQKGLEVAKRYKITKMKFAHLNLLSLIYKKSGNNSKAIQMSYEFLNLCEEKKDTPSTIAALINLSSLLTSNLDTPNAKKILFRALPLLKHIKIPQYKTAAYISLYHLVKDPNQKESSLKTAIHEARKNHLNYYLGVGYKTYGYFYYNTKINYDSALYYFKKAEHLALTFKNNESLINIRTMMAKLYQKTGKIDTAINLLKHQIQDLKTQDNLQELVTVYQIISSCYEDQKNYPNAYRFLKLNRTISDSLYTADLKRQLADANARYEAKKKDAEIAISKIEISHQKKQKQLIIIISSLIIIAITFLSYALYNLIKRKKIATEKALQSEQLEVGKLQEIDNLKTQFFTNISHELKTPLTLIVNPIESLLRSNKNRAISKELERASTNCKKLLNLVDEILELSKLENGHIELNTKTQNIKSLIQHHIRQISTLATQKQIELDLHYKLPDGVCMSIDDVKFEKILCNLLSNAIKFSKRNSRIEIYVTDDERNLLIDVVDQGIGLSETEIELIFNRFYQSKRNTPRLHGGTGIGLSIARNLTKLMGGDLTVQSQINQGSVFKLRIPKLDWTLPPDLDQISNSWDIPSSRDRFFDTSSIKPILLLVEDDIEMINYLSDLLSKKYNCLLASNGISALKLLNEYKVDLILSDILMPEMDGFEFKKEINSNPKLCDIPFIFLTAKSLTKDKIQGLRLGVDDYVTKPFNEVELLTRIKNLLLNKSIRDKWNKEEALLIRNDELNHTKETEILLKAKEVVEANISNSEFKVKELAIQLNYSERQLRRVFKQMTGYTPVGFILEIRLQKAYHLIENSPSFSINQIRYEVGIESASYFTTKFKERFGQNPTALLKRCRINLGQTDSTLS